MQSSQARDGSTYDRRPVRVLVFGASLRRGSLNARLAALAAQVAEQKGARADLGQIADFDCPSYNQDVEDEQGVPTGAQHFRDRLVSSDAYIVASPEYNAAMPGMLKNVIDWTSRVRPQPFNGRQGLLLSASPSMAGGNRGLWALRVPLEHLGSRVYPDMFSLSQAHQAFGADGRIADATLQQRFEMTIECFLDLVEAAKHYRALKTQWVEYLGERPDPMIDRVESTAVDAG
ncbi:MAG TPA: NAD(P)H-dependent oxidoreductase [Gemmatimonadaceae bacterium]|nr:NAD(P)H-dependent oxidoreductase [Gemmatimonadaceae bacterium]